MRWSPRGLSAEGKKDTVHQAGPEGQNLEAQRGGPRLLAVDIFQRKELVKMKYVLFEMPR